MKHDLDKNGHPHTALIQVGGMTCANCSARIEAALSALPGVFEARADFSRGEAFVRFDPAAVSRGAIEREITRLGYTAGGGNEIARTAVLLATIVGLYTAVERLGLLNALVPSRLAGSGMGFGMLFAVGLLTSVHCVAMCGGIGLSQSLAGISANHSADRRKNLLRFSALTYNAGRVVSYTAAGFLLGLAGRLLGGGGGVGIPLLAQGALKILAGVFMVISGLSMLGLFPALRRMLPALPRLVPKKSGGRPFAVGLLNGLMPCGPLQSMQVLALASGSPVSGAASMLAFSLGTVPLMLGLGALVSALGKKFARAVTAAGAVLVAVMGLSMLAQGGSLSGMIGQAALLRVLVALCAAGIASLVPEKKIPRVALASLAFVSVLSLSFRLPLSSPSQATAENPPVRIVDGVQVVESELLPGRYPTITVESGIPVRWTIRAPARSINGCNWRMTIGEFGITHSFEEGDNVIEFTPQKAGSVPYTCWMGMIRGTIIVSAARG